MNSELTPEGLLYKFNETTLFFANKYFQSATSKMNIPTKVFSCEQIHSNIIKKANPKKTYQCDGLYTDLSDRTALKIRTADCLPILVFNYKYKFAIHAGWRGLESSILSYLSEFNFNESSYAVIGPHIQQYEVGREVIEAIKTTHPHLKNFFEQFIFEQENDKYLLNLSLLAQIQLIALGFTKAQILISTIDTLTNNDWHSYRRDQEKAGRNYSFIF